MEVHRREGRNHGEGNPLRNMLSRALMKRRLGALGRRPSVLTSMLKGCPFQGRDTPEETAACEWPVLEQ